MGIYNHHHLNNNNNALPSFRKVYYVVVPIALFTLSVYTYIAYPSNGHGQHHVYNSLMNTEQLSDKEQALAGERR